MLDNNLDQLISSVTRQMTTTEIALSLVAALLLSIAMWGAYRIAHSNATYNMKFLITLITLAFVSTVLMDLIQTNLALSLGMLGSLSIVRFRTNIKDPRDIGFLFWSMAIGLASATQNYIIGIIGSIIIAIIMYISRNRAVYVTPMLLVIRGSETNLDKMQEILDGLTFSNNVKAKNIMSDSFELVYEVQIPMEKENKMINKIFDLRGIDSVNFLTSEHMGV